MSLLQAQVIELRRQMDLLKRTQVVISDSQPHSPSSQSIWREGATLKSWDGKNWIDMSGSSTILDFTTSVVFSSSAYNNITWSVGAINIGVETGVATHSISAGGFTMTENTFVYWDPSIPTALQTTTTPATAITSGGIIIAVGQINSDTSAAKAAIKTFGNKQNDLITADQIVANTITANQLATSLLYAGSIILNTNGLIRGGQTAYNTGTGFFLGYSGGAYKFSIGDSSANYMTYDSTNLIINGGTIRTGTSGQRIEISGNNFKSYDSSGVLRIQTANEGMRITDTTGSYHADFSSRSFSGPGAVEWPYILVSDTSTPSTRVGLRTSFLAGHPTATDKSLRLYLDGGSVTFRSIGGGGTSGTGITLTSPDDDTLTFDGKKISFNGVILEKIGSDLYWNGVKIN